MPLVLSSPHPGRFAPRRPQAMPPKRKRPTEEQAQHEALESPLARRATRQTPVLPPVPPTSAATGVRVADRVNRANRVIVNPVPLPATAAAAAAPAATQPPTQPHTRLQSAEVKSDPKSKTATIAISNTTAQTPVPIPAPPGQPAPVHDRDSERERPRSANPPPPVPPAPVQTPVPIPIVTPVSPPSVPRQPRPIAASHPTIVQSMAGVAFKENIRPSNLVAPEIVYHVPQPSQPGQLQSSLLRPHGPTALPPRFERRPAPPVVTPVLPPKPPTLAVNNRGPPRPDRNIDKVVLGDLCFRTWYPSYYGKEVLGDASGNARNGGGSKDGSQDANNKSSKKDKDQAAMLERLYVCPGCFKYAKELVAWRGHVRICERKGFVPGKKVYVHPQGRRKVFTAYDGKGQPPGPKRRRGDGGVRYTEEIVQDEGEWSIWEVDGEKEGLFCQNLSLFAKLFLDNKSVFFDVTGFNYFLLVYTPPARPFIPGAELVQSRPPQVTGFFSKEKMSWDNNNLACILVFPPWQRKGLGALLMGASYEISRREGILGGPEKPISDLGKKGYKRFWTGEIARWLLSLENTALQQQQQQQSQHQQQQVSSPQQSHELIVDVGDCSQGTWIATEDCLTVLRDMGVLEDAGMGYGKPEKVVEAEEEEEDSQQAPDVNDGMGQKQQLETNSKSAEEKKPPAPPPVKIVPRVRVDKEAVRRYVATHRISLERTCDPNGFAEGYAMKMVDNRAGSEGDRSGMEL